MNAAQILVVDDEADIRTLIEEILSEEGYRVKTAADAKEARARIADDSPDLVLLDIWMPDTDGISLLNEWSSRAEVSCPVVIMSGHGTVETAVEATRLGAGDYVEKPLSLAKLLRTVETALETDLVPQKESQRSMLTGIESPVGRSDIMTRLREQARQLAAGMTPVLILGERGSGREAVASYMHMLGKRSAGPFVHLRPATLTPDNMSELLLGTERDDTIEPGYLERAAGGTLFIDGLDTLCPEAQSLLYGLLEQRGFARVGRAEEIPLDVRVIASASPDTGGIRPELVASLSVSTMRVPPLREHAEDVPDLLRYFVDRLVDTHGASFRRFGVAAQNRLRHYPWPGNLGELRRLVAALLASGGKEEIGLDEVESRLETATVPEGLPLVEQDLLALPLREARERFERAYLTQQLSLCGGKVGRLAKRVGMERTHLYRKLRSLGVDFRQIGHGE